MVDDPPVHPEEPPEDSPGTLFAAERFLRRLPSRIRTHSSVASLEKLLSVADTRAAQLRESWPSTRAGARRLSADD